jgi:virginiamycin B lyase
VFRPQESIALAVLFAGLALPAAAQFVSEGSAAIAANSVALSSGGTTAMLANTNRDGGPSGQPADGGVWFFARQNGAWSAQGGKIREWAWFAVSAALSADGNTAIVGTLEGGGNAPYAHVFYRSQGVWSDPNITLTGFQQASFISASLSSDGGTALVNNVVFVRTQSGWTQQGAPLGSAAVSALSGDGNTAIVAAPAGNVGFFVYTRANGRWTEQAGPVIPSDAASGAQATSLALSSDGSVALVGAASGAWVFARANGSWVQQTPKLGSAGNSVALSADGRTAIVSGAGIAVYRLTNGTWNSQGTAAAAAAVPIAVSGDGSIAMSGGATTNFYTSNQVSAALGPFVFYLPAGASGALTLAITLADPNSTWSATAGAPWITINSPSTGIGSGSLSFSVAANPSINPRSAGITVAGQTATIYQAAALPNFTYSYLGQTPLEAAPSSGSITVTSSLADASWTAVSNDNWITVTSPASNTGSGVVTYQVTANELAPRTGTITIAGTDVFVRQKGPEPITTFPTKGEPDSIVVGSDGALWFTEYGNPGRGIIGRSTMTGVITEYHVSGTIIDITAGPDGALWFTGFGNSSLIGRMTTAGAVTLYPSNSEGFGITAGPDGALWFTETIANSIGRITTAGVITEFPLPHQNRNPMGITSGPDGAVWFTESGGVGRITTSGTITEYPLPGPVSCSSLAAGPDGALWCWQVQQTGPIIPVQAYVFRISTAGVVTVFPAHPPDFSGGDFKLTPGPDGALWLGGGWLGRITTTGSVTFFSAFADGIVTGPDGAIWFGGYPMMFNGKFGLNRMPLHLRRPAGPRSIH